MNDRKRAEEKLARFISESAQQIWAAGLGALTVAEKEGSKLFETLAKLGENLESGTRKTAGSASQKMSGARDSAGDTWEKLEDMFEKRVARALKAMNIPSEHDMTELTKRIDKLSAKVDKLAKKTSAAGKKKKKNKTQSKNKKTRRKKKT